MYPSATTLAISEQSATDKVVNGLWFGTVPVEERNGIRYCNLSWTMLVGLAGFNVGLVRVGVHNPEPSVQHVRVCGANDRELVIVLLLCIRVPAVQLQSRLGQVIRLLIAFPIFGQVSRCRSFGNSTNMGLDPLDRVDAFSMVPDESPQVRIHAATLVLEKDVLHPLVDHLAVRNDA